MYIKKKAKQKKYVGLNNVYKPFFSKNFKYFLANISFKIENFLLVFDCPKFFFLILQSQKMARWY